MCTVHCSILKSNKVLPRPAIVTYFQIERYFPLLSSFAHFEMLEFEVQLLR